MKKVIAWLAIAPMLAACAQTVRAELSLTTGLDYSSGKYDSTDTTTVREVPVMLKYEAAPWTFTAYIPYVDVDGVANPEVGGTVTSVSESQSGLGDTVVGGFYELFPRGGSFGMDVGIKAKLVTADRNKDLLTTGNPDYTLQSNFYTLAGPGTLLATVGWTKKGDIRVLDSQGQFQTLNPDDPLSLGLAYSYSLSERTRLGVAYDWRQRLFSDTDDVSEASFLMSYRYSSHWRVQGYLLTGFSNASPDWGGGAFIGYTW